jgi:hypothetical protein
MIWLVVLLVLVIVGSGAWYLGKKPYLHRNIRQQDLRRYLEVLLFRGYDRGFICIQIPHDKRFLQFSKYIGANSLAGLQFDFPLAQWSTQFYEPLRKLLEEKGIPYEIKKTGQEKVREFLVVDAKQDLDLARELALLVLQGVYGLAEHACVQLYFSGVSPRDERIGF